MRILHISTRLILGGSQENTVLSCEGQARLGHEVHLAFGPIYGPEGSLLERVEGFRTDDDRRITTHLVPHMIRRIDPIADPRCYFELRGLIRRIRPDIVHTHSSKAGIIGRHAAWHEGGSRGRPGVVHTIHGPPFHPYEKRWRNSLYIAMERIAARHCHAIVSVADAMTKQFLDARIGHREQYATVYSGMEIEPFLNAALGESRDAVRASLGLAPDAVVIGTVGRLAEHKGHDDLIDALADDLRANDRWRLLWVGDGWWRGRLTERLDRAGIRDRVVLTGLVPPQRVPGLIRAMDVLVHPSYREGLPRTVPQALLAGVPVVAYDVDGTCEACIDFKTGRLVAPGIIAGLRDAVRWMIEDPARARATADAGRELCRERFDARRMVEELEKVYARALASRVQSATASPA